MNIIKLALLLLITFSSHYLLADVDYQINGVDKDEKNNITIFLQGLTTPADADNSSYLKQVEKSTRNALNALGYYQITLKTTVSGKRGKQTVVIDISKGKPTRITALNIKLTGEGEDASTFSNIVDDFAIKLNDILHHGHYEEAKQSLKKAALEHGYFDAKYVKSSVEVSSKTNSATVYLWFNTGVRYQFGELHFEPDIPAELFIRSLQPFQTGDPFTSKLLTQFNRDINKTEYFKSIIIIPELQQKQGLQVPLHVIAKMRPEDSFNVGLGYSTDQGVRGKLRWSRPWVNSQGHSIEGKLAASMATQETTFTYKIPVEDPLYNYLSIQSGFKRVIQNDTDTSEYLLSFNRHWRLSNKWLQQVFIKYDLETGVQGQQDFSTQLIVPGISYRLTRSRGGINAYWGDKKLVSLEASNKLWLSSNDLIKAYGQFKLLRRYKNHQFISYTEFGAIYADSIEEVPASMRFYTGGDQSVRGYDYESIAPKDEQGYILGGKYLAVAGVEYRLPITEKWKLALFGDAGTATNDFSEEISTSVGTGIVWSSPIGPIRFYIAKPLTDNDNSLAIHFMIGPEL